MEVLLRRLLADRPGALVGALALAGLPFLLLHGPFWAGRWGIDVLPASGLAYGLTWGGHLLLVGLLASLGRSTVWSRPLPLWQSISPGLVLVFVLVFVSVLGLPPALAFQVIAGSLAGATTVALTLGTLDVFERRFLEEDGQQPGPSGGSLLWASLPLGALVGAVVLAVWVPEPGATALSEHWFGVAPPEWLQQWMHWI